MTRLSDTARKYLDVIDATGLVRTRVDHFVDMYGSLYPDGAFEGVFVSDAINEENGSRSWTSLWFYGPNYVAECKNFLFIDDWDLASIQGLMLWAAKSEEYSPSNVTEASRLSLTWSTEKGVNGVMTATGLNCHHLTLFLKGCLILGMKTQEV